MQYARLILLTICSVMAFQDGKTQHIAFGEKHVIAINTDNKVIGWGQRKQHFYWNGRNDITLWTPEEVVKKNVYAVSAGRRHNLALSDENKVYAWGSNVFGECSIPKSINSHITAVAAGSRHSMALREDGKVFVWGDNSVGQCDVPLDLTDVVAIATSLHTCAALTSNGRVVLWGKNKCEIIALSNDIISISLGHYRLLALTATGLVREWSLDDGNCLEVSVPEGLRNVIDIAAGRRHALALKGDGTVIAWGANDVYQSEVPYKLKNAIAIEAGYNNSGAILESKLVSLWGDEEYGQCSKPAGLILKEPKRNSRLIPRSEGIATNDTNSHPKCGKNQDNLPPILVIKESSLALSDTCTILTNSSNNAIDAFEILDVSMSVTNTGPGCGKDLALNIHVDGDTSGLSWISPWFIHDIPPGETTEVHFPLKSGKNTKDGSVTIDFEIIEPRGFNSDMTSIIVETRQFRSPKVEIADWSAEPSIWKPNSPISLDVVVQNIGHGTAETVEVKLQTPELVNCYSSNKSITYEHLEPGESQLIHYDFLVPRTFNDSKVEISVGVTEKHGEYGEVWNQKFQFQSNSIGKSVIIQPEETIQPSIERASLSNSAKSSASVSFKDSQASFQISSIAVIPKEIISCEGQRDDADALASYTENNILSHYSVVDRRHLEAVLEELRLQMSGLTFEESVLESGCIENAEAYLFVQSNCLMGDEMIEIRLVHCETSTLIWSCTGVNATPQEVLEKINEELDRTN